MMGGSYAVPDYSMTTIDDGMASLAKYLGHESEGVFAQEQGSRAYMGQKKDHPGK